MDNAFQAPINMTSRDLSRDPLLAHAQGNGLRVSFEWRNVRIETADDALNGKTERRLIVIKKPLGDKYSEVMEQIDPKVAARIFPQEWAMFSTYQEVPTDGTPLLDLPGATQSEIAIMHLHGIRSIEDMREISEDQAAQIGFDATRMRKLAITWLEKKEGNAETIDVSDRLASIERALSAAQQRNEAMERRNIELEGALKAVQSGVPGGQASAGIGSVEVDAPTINEDDGFMGGGGMESDQPDPLLLDD